MIGHGSGRQQHGSNGAIEDAVRIESEGLVG